MAPRYFIVTDVTCVLRHIDDKIGELYISTLNLPKKVLSSKSGEGESHISGRLFDGKNGSTFLGGLGTATRP